MSTSAITPATRTLRARHYVAYALACFLLGSNWPAVRVLVRDVPPMRAAGLGYVVACLLTFLLSVHADAPRPCGAADWRRLTVMALSLLAVPTGTITWAEQYINASLTAVIYAALPLAVTLIVRLTTRHRVPATAMIAMIIGALGIVVLFFNGVPHTSIGRTAALAVTASVFVCAWGVVYASNAPARLTSTRAIAMQFAICALVTLSLSVLLESHRQANWNLSSIAALLFIGVFCTSLMVVLYYWLLKQIATFQVATIDLVVPVVAFLEGVFFLQERITPAMLAAAVVVLASTGYVLRLTSPAPEPQETSAASIQDTIS